MTGLTVIVFQHTKRTFRHMQMRNNGCRWVSNIQHFTDIMRSEGDIEAIGLFHRYHWFACN